LAAALLASCSPMRGEPFDPDLEGRDLYLCCNLYFDIARAASDANYERYRSSGYGPGPELAAGTRVKIVKVGSSGVQFTPEDSSAIYTLGFSYGKKVMSARDYFANIFRQSDPTESLQGVSRRLQIAIEQGQLIEGMTREQALMTRGYPPAHRTPDLAADEWIYFVTGGTIDRVKFSAGKIASISRQPADE
jgi:hypothetical protein